MKNESALSKFIKKLYTDTGAIVFNVHGGIMQSSGWPDLDISMFGGHSLHIELKHNEGKVKGNQETSMRNLILRGHMCIVLRYRESTELLSVETPNGTEINVYPSHWVRKHKSLFMDALYMDAARVPAIMKEKDGVGSEE